MAAYACLANHVELPIIILTDLGVQGFMSRTANNQGCCIEIMFSGFYSDVADMHIKVHFNSVTGFKVFCGTLM